MSKKSHGDYNEWWPYNLLAKVFGEPKWYSCEPDYIICKDRAKGIGHVIAQLPPRTRDIILMRFRDNMSLHEVASIVGLTGPRIRQIEAKGLQEIRNPKNNIYLIYGYDGAQRLLHARSKKEELRELETSLEKREREIAVRKQAVEDEEKRLGIMVSANGKTPELDMLPIEKLQLSTRAFNCLHRAGIEYFYEAVRLVSDPEKMMNIRNLGKYSAKEIVMKLYEYGVDYREEYKNYIG